MKVFINNKIDLSIENCDVVKEQANILVNTTNSQLIHDGGLANAFKIAGGKAIENNSKSWIEKHGKIPVGGLAVTTAG